MAVEYRVLIWDRSMSISDCGGVLIVISAWVILWASILRTCEKNTIPRASVTKAWNSSTIFPHLMGILVKRSL